MSNNKIKACYIGLHSKLVFRCFGITPGGLDRAQRRSKAQRQKKLPLASARGLGVEDKNNVQNAEILHDIERRM
jgi:hypothetical protein